MSGRDPVIEKYLADQYKFVLNENQLSLHYDNYVETGQSSSLAQGIVSNWGNETVVLDIGCGYGSLVMLLRESGFKAFGTDMAKFEIAHARRKFEEISTNSEEIYVCTDSPSSFFGAHTFDLITAWNVLEHVSDLATFLDEIDRNLKSGGNFLFLCPNYGVLRREAHYGLLWIPFLPKSIYRKILILMKKNPEFFDSNIFPITKFRVIREFHKRGFKLQVPKYKLTKIVSPGEIKNPYKKKLVDLAVSLKLNKILEFVLILSTFNILSRSIEFQARKL